jgi:hypothetical protein
LFCSGHGQRCADSTRAHSNVGIAWSKIFWSKTAKYVAVQFSLGSLGIAWSKTAKYDIVREIPKILGVQ